MRWLEARRRAPGAPPFQTIFFWTGVQKLVLFFFLLFYGLRRFGRANVPAEGPLIYASNHQSHFDPPLVGTLVHDRPFTSMARASLFRFAPFRAVLRMLSALPIERGRGDLGAIKALLGELEAGRCVLVFPEGTRTEDGALGPFKPGLRLLLKRSSARVVPCAVEGAYDIWPRNRRWPRFRGRLFVKAGESVSAEELLNEGGGDPIEPLRRRIEALRLELRGELRRLTRGKYPAPGPADRACWEERRDAEAERRRDEASQP